MTQLICKVQRLFLNDDKHTCIRENEVFEVAEPTATEYVIGGIAKPVPAPIKEPEPVKAEEPDNEAERVEPPQQKKRR